MPQIMRKILQKTPRSPAHLLPLFASFIGCVLASSHRSCALIQPLRPEGCLRLQSGWPSTQFRASWNRDRSSRTAFSSTEDTEELPPSSQKRIESHMRGTCEGGDHLRFLPAFCKPNAGAGGYSFGRDQLRAKCSTSPFMRGFVAKRSSAMHVQGIRMGMPGIDPQLVEDVSVLSQFVSDWIVDEMSDPERAAQQFLAMERNRIISIETLMLSPLYFLLVKDPTSPTTTAITRSWATMLLLSVVFGGIGSTFGFYFFDFAMARCIAFDANRKPSLAVSHSILACMIFGAPYGWLSNKVTGLVSYLSQRSEAA